ncbi:MAG: hypothetical protein MI741_03815, partial [Rhodospirillales bacterium]|nr:hypothetical protein [Rhodospirillales bacterium]
MSITRYVGTLSVVIALLACTRVLASQNASQEPGREQLQVFTSDSELAAKLRALPVSEQKLLGDRLHDRFASTPELLQSLSHGEARGLARVLRLLGDYRGWNLYVDWCSLQEDPAFLDDPHVLGQIAVDLEMLNYLAYTAP